MSRRTSAARSHVASLAMGIGIAVALLAPLSLPSTLPGGWSLPHLDKLGHLVLFLAAALLWRRSLALLGFRRPALVCLLLAVAYGGLLEIAQGFTATRQPELTDLGADALGALLALLFPR